MNPRVAILAGGLATRMYPATRTVPKALLDVAGKPFAVRQIELLRQQGLKDIVFCLGFLGEQVQARLGTGQEWGVRLSYVFDGTNPLGTGGALRKALPLLGETFLVLYGDSYLECDYQAVIRAFQQSGKQGLMTVFHNADQWDQSNIVFESGNIVRYEKQSPTPEMQYIDYGLGLLRSESVKRFSADQPVDLATIYQDLLLRNELAGFEVKQRFYEIGSPAGLEELIKYFSKKEYESR